MTVADTTGSDPRQSVVATISSEHRAIGQVVDLLQHLLGSIAAQHAEADFELLSVCLNYLKDFPGRFHHPKEDGYLFKAIRAHAPVHTAALNQLEAEHVLDTHMLRDLHSALVRYQAGAPNALERLRALLDIYAAMLRDHMRKEETLIASLQDEIPEEEWRGIAQAFSIDGDPLFGPSPRRDFELVRERIRGRLPAKLRPAAAAIPS